MAYYVLEFIFVAVITYLFYYYFFMKKNKKKNVKPIEFSYLEARYNLRLEKIKREKLAKTVSIINSMIFATVFVTVGFINNMILQLLMGGLIVIILTVLSYYFLAKYYEKRGMTKKCIIQDK